MLLFATPAFAQLSELLEPVRWREVGPYRGGRVAAVCGLPDDPQTYYFGGCGGGVWKTTDAGRNWRCVSDGFFGGSIGAVAVAPSDPNVVYVGGGEKTVRGNVSHGDGAWRSDDAGRTWRSIGLADSRHICRIRVHPSDPDVAYAAVLGHLFGDNAERGVFRTKDGGASWQRVLHVNDQAGAVDLCMDPTNPRVLYACMWRVLRTPYSLESGGEGSGIWKSTDGGDEWVEIGGNPGLPTGTTGISGICVSPTDPDNVYAIVEAEKGGVFRSRDAGETWTRVNDDRSLRQRAWYYTRIYADPADAEAVYVLNVGFHRSVDGGRTFRRIRTPHGDNHDLWIAPDDPRRMVQSNDGGANVSEDGGASWTAQDNQPTAQVYRISVDNSFPYRILGAQQDNSAFRIRSRGASGGGVGVRDWEPTAGGESGHIVAKPDDNDIVVGGSYGGFLTWLDHRTRERRAVNVWPDNPMGWGAADLRYRFQWNFPLFFSPHDPDVLYAAGNVLFVSRDLGASWQPISPDLTRDDSSRLGPSGGPITKDNTGVEYYCTIFAAAESALEPGLLWAGSDDGLLHVSRDGGERWQNVTPPGLPEWAQINSIDVDPWRPGGLYVAATRYKSDDFRPYLFATADYGASWREIVAGIEPDHFTRVIRADPAREGLLYAGTERGVYVSFDDGGVWQSLQLDLPVAPVTDLQVAHGDLIVATQGRGIWVLDDLAVVHQVSPRGIAEPVALLQPEPCFRLVTGSRRPARGDVERASPASGAVLYYWLAEELEADAALTLEIRTAGGEIVRTLRRARDESETEDTEARGAARRDAVLAAGAGLHRVEWDLRYGDAEGFPGMVLWNRRLTGPMAVPGMYTVHLTAGEHRAEAELEVRADPRSGSTPEHRAAQLQFSLEVRDKLTETHRAIARLRTVRKGIAALLARADGIADGDGVRDAATALRDALTGVEEALYQTQSKSAQDPLNFPIRLNDKLAGLLSLVSTGDRAPTRQALQVRDELVEAIDAQLVVLDGLLSERLPELNRQAGAAGVPAVDPAAPESK